MGTNTVDAFSQEDSLVRARRTLTNPVWGGDY